MIRVLTANASAEFVREYQQADALSWLQRPPAGHVRWIDITAQNEADLEKLRQGFGFHPLPLEDCLHFDQRPKLEEFPSNDPYAFVVIHHFGVCMHDKDDEEGLISIPAAAATEQPTSVRLEELHAFLGTNYLVTLHKHPIEPLERVWKRIGEDSALFMRGCDFVYYLVADALCDSNFPILESISDTLDGIEEQVIDSPQKQILTKIYETRKGLVAMRRALSPQRDLMALLARHGGSTLIQNSTSLYFRDVYDHLVRINEAIESARDLLGNCVDAYLSAVSQRTNEIMKQLTILSAVMLPLTFIVGFFGMNFEALPFKSMTWLMVVLGLMFLFVPGMMIYWFYRKHWL